VFSHKVLKVLSLLPQLFSLFVRPSLVLNKMFMLPPPLFPLLIKDSLMLLLSHSVIKSLIVIHKLTMG
jgi:hypothetical protein